MIDKPLNAETIYGKVVEAGETWADTDAAATLLEETKSSVLAELFVKQPQDLSIAVREHNAKADPVYRLHIVNMVNARQAANRAKVRFDGAKLLAELRRSEEATQRAGMRNA